MGKLKFFLLAASFFFIQKSCADVGCLVGNTLYTTLTNGCTRCYDNTPGDIVSPCGWIRIGSTNTCRVYDGSGSVFSTSNYAFYGDGYSNNWSKITLCPIDNYSWLLILPISGIGLYRLRKRNLITC